MLNNLTGLKKTVKSVENQKHTDYEVWIIDGGSKQETLNYLKQMNNPFHWVSEADKGLYDAMNKGIDLAKGEWLYFLGSGDELENHDVLARIFSNDLSEKYDVISGKVKYHGSNKPFIYSKTKDVKTPSWNFFMWIRNGLHHQGTCYKKELFNDINYSLEYPVFADYWFNLMLYKKNKSCHLVNYVIAKCPSDGVSKQGRRKNYKEEVQFKVALSSIVFFPFFFLVAALKISLKKIV